MKINIRNFVAALIMCHKLACYAESASVVHQPVKSWDFQTDAGYTYIRKTEAGTLLNGNGLHMGLSLLRYFYPSHRCIGVGPFVEGAFVLGTRSGGTLDSGYYAVVGPKLVLSNVTKSFRINFTPGFAVMNAGSDKNGLGISFGLGIDYSIIQRSHFDFGLSLGGRYSSGFKTPYSDGVYTVSQLSGRIGPFLSFLF